jgi:hypothetical protein
VHLARISADECFVALQDRHPPRRT